jgi:hypothetical protein
VGHLSEGRTLCDLNHKTTSKTLPVLQGRLITKSPHLNLQFSQLMGWQTEGILPKTRAPEQVGRLANGTYKHMLRQGSAG